MAARIRSFCARVSRRARFGPTANARNFPYVGPGGYSEQEDAKIYQGCKIDTSITYGVLLGSVGSAPNGAFPIGQGGTFTAGNNGDL